VSRRNWYLLTNSVVLVWITAGLMAVGVHRFVDQPLWLMVHVPLLGAATAAILIWSQHFADTLLRRPALGGRVGLGIRLLGHTVGAALIVVGILAGVPPLAVTGAIGVAAVALAHGIVLTLQLRHALPARFAPLVRYYIAASAVFLGGIAAGIVIVLTGEPGTADRLVMSHLVLNVFGWLGVTVLGT